MNNNLIDETEDYLTNLCIKVKSLIENYELDAAENMISLAMAKYPHSGIPHNLMGIVLEKKHNHHLAMNHFRASWALDPTLLAARMNMESFGTFVSSNKIYYQESDCEEHQKLKKSLVNINLERNK